MTFNIKDMNISLDALGRVVQVEGGFGSAPIRREGEAVEYDASFNNSPHEIEFESTDAEVINEE